MKRILLSLALMASLPAHAGYVDGYKLKNWSDSVDRMAARNPGPDDSWNADRFHGYIWGVYDAYQEVLLCSPDSAKTAQMTALIQQYLKAHPERWDRAGSSLILEALRDTYACKK